MWLPSGFLPTLSECPELGTTLPGREADCRPDCRGSGPLGLQSVASCEASLRCQVEPKRQTTRSTRPARGKYRAEPGRQLPKSAEAKGQAGLSGLNAFCI